MTLMPVPSAYKGQAVTADPIFPQTYSSSSSRAHSPLDSRGRAYASNISHGWHHHTFPEAQPRVLATTGPDGTFQARFPKSVMANAFSTTQTQRPWRWAELVAGADGYGPTWGGVNSETNAYELKLVQDDVPVRGRVLDLHLARPVKKEAFLVGEARTVESAVSSTADDPIKGMRLAPGEIRELAAVRVDGPKQTVGGRQ